MNHASLFSGIGGAEVAASMMGWQNLFHCEIQEFPRKVLDYWFPNSESYEDITKTDFTKSMFSQEDSPANLSPSLAEERERTITATSGHRCFERYGRYTPLGSLVKTLMESRRWWSPAKSLRWDAQTIFSKRITYTERKADSPSTKSVQTSKPKDIPSNRLLFQLVPSEHRTEETESGLLPTVQTQGLKQFNKKGKTEFVPLDLLPTPNAMDIAHKDMEINERGRRNPKKGKTDHSLGLEDMAVAQLLPTPTALDKGGGRINKSLSPNAAERPTLALAARKGLLPTPCSIEATKYTKTINPNSQMGQGLTSLAVNGLLPTPTAMEVKHSNRVKGLKEQGAKGMYSRKNGALRPNGLTDFLDFHYLLTPMAADGMRANMNMQALKNHNKEKANLSEQIAHKVGGGTSQLNPLFVEEMMGFPLMWTALPFLSPSGDKNP